MTRSLRHVRPTDALRPPSRGGVLLGVLLLIVPASAAHAETGSSGWLQRTTPAVSATTGQRSITQPPQRQRPIVRGRARSLSLRPSTPTEGARPTTSIEPAKPLRSTLGPIMAPVEGPNAAFIAYDQGQYITARRLAQEQAERNDPQATTLLGRIYENGLGVQRNALTAAKLYRRAAELGDTEALFSFAVMLAAGRGIAKNPKGAADLFERAARTGHPEANYNLGLMFISGIGKPENPRRALMHIEYAAKKGIPAAQYDVAALYRKGVGTTPDAYMANYWLRKAAYAGMAAAEYEYAVRLLQGQGFNSDKPEIVDYLIAAARQGIPGAQNRLAHIYSEGVLVRRNLAEAAKWRLIAKASGRHDAEYDKALDKKIAGLSGEARLKARIAAENFTEGARVGDGAVAAAPAASKN